MLAEFSVIFLLIYVPDKLYKVKKDPTAAIIFTALVLLIIFRLLS